MADNSNNNNWNIGLGLELKPDAISSINEQIKSIGGSAEKIKIDIDKNYFKSQINSIKSELSKLSISQLTNIGNLVNGNKTSKSNKISIGDTKKTSEELDRLKNQIEQFTNMQNRMGKLKIKIIGLEQAGEETKHLKAMLEELESSYDKLWHSFQKKINTSDLVVGDFKKISNDAIDLEHKIEVLKAAYEDARISMAKDIQTDISNGKLSKQISDIETKFSQLSGDTGEVSTKINELRTLMNTMDSNDDIESVIADYEKFKNLLASTSNEVRELQNAQKVNQNSAQLSEKRTKLTSDIDIWLNKNSAAAKQFGLQLEQIKAQIASADGTKLINLRTQFTEVKRQAELAGVATQTFGDKLKAQLSKFGNFLTVPMLINKGIQGLRTMYNDVLAIDTAMTELYRVTDLTDKQYQNLYENMTKSAKEYAVSLDTIIASTASWVRLGFDAETSNRLAEITAMYQHVTDLGEKEAVENLVTAYKGFQESLLKANNNDETQAILQIADIYDKLGNEFAESAADVGDGLSKSASVLQQGGASIQEAAGMFTGIQEVLQNSSTSGKALQIMTLRIRGMKGQLEELGEEVDDKIDSISKIQTQILNLTQGRVNIFDDVGDFRNIYDIMKDIANVWDSLSSQDSAALLEIIAGKNRSNAVQALINNWSQVEKATKAAYAAEGTATAENEKYLKSMQGRLDTLKASAQALSATIMDSDTLKSGISLLNSLVNILDTGIDKLGVLPTLFTAIAGGLSFKNIGRCRLFHLIVNMPIVIIVLLRYR